MTRRLPSLLTLTLFFLIAGGGLYLVISFGVSHTATPPPPAVVVVPAPGENVITYTPSNAASSSPLVTLSAPSTVGGTQPTVLHLALNVLEPSATPTITATPSITPSPSITFTPSDTSTATATSSNTPLPGINGVPESSYLPTVSQRALGVYQYGLTLGNRPGSFSRLGDCHSSSPGFLGAFDVPGSFRLGDYSYLQAVVDYYSGSFIRQSQAAYAGLHMGSFFSPLWASPDYCVGAENVMDCEYRLYQPSVIFLNIGTLNMASPNEEYERFVRPIIEYWISKGVVPILNTKADNIEGDDRFNNVMRRLAYEYDMPLWDFARVIRTLPDNGLQSDQVHLSEGQPYFDDPVQLQTGWTLRNLTGLQALYTVWSQLH